MGGIVATRRPPAGDSTLADIEGIHDGGTVGDAFSSESVDGAPCGAKRRQFWKTYRCTCFRPRKRPILRKTWKRPIVDTRVVRVTTTPTPVGTISNVSPISRTNFWKFMSVRSMRKESLWFGTHSRILWWTTPWSETHSRSLTTPPWPSVTRHCTGCGTPNRNNSLDVPSIREL